MTTEGEEFLGVKQQDSPGAEVAPPSSGWAITFYIFGAIGLLASSLVLVALIDEEATLATFAISVAFTLQMFFAGFIVDVLTDMRWYLKTLVKREKE